ncbi:hypothetical protein FRC04_000685 [Tulasnella sp. 424]|nr:hypothetical protein FRC04_000685 [Tulasnella sp. 424]KAG8967706.1 hypothetical protein FRC05_001964 [Tulasnella sp. 425]
MFSPFTKFQLVSLVAALSSSVAYAGHVGEGAIALDARASSLTLPDIFTNGTAQVKAITQQLQRFIVFNNTLNADPSSVEALLTKVQTVVNSTSTQINQIGKLPFDQISGGLTQSDIQYVSTDFVTAVALSVVAPQSIAATYPEIQKSIDGVQACIIPLRGWLCIFFPWLCGIWPPFLLIASATFAKIGQAITP